jgi:uncharacterized phage-associated protein
MASSVEVARYLIHLASPREDEDVDCLCHLRLQKLLYYVQGWHLGAYGKPLFPGRIEAWTHGPVVKEVYAAFAGYKYNSIPPSEGRDSATLSKGEKDFVRCVWEQYKQYSATALRDMTHGEYPWKRARGRLGPYQKSSEEIIHDSMRNYFGHKVAARLPSGISLVQLIQAEEDIEQGRFQTHQELKAGLAEKGHAI